MPKAAPSALFGSALTERETDILILLAAGFSGADVARWLEISKTTLGGHLLNARLRLGARTTTELVVRFLASAMARGEAAEWPPIRPPRRP